MNSEVCPEGAEIGFRDGACSVCTGYRLHPSAHNFAPIERERERPRVAQQRDEQRWKSVYVRAFICEWMSERVKDNNKRDEHGRTKMQRERERESADRSCTPRGIFDTNIGKKVTLWKISFCEFLFFFLWYTYDIQKRVEGMSFGVVRRAKGDFFSYRVSSFYIRGSKFLKTDG